MSDECHVRGCKGEVVGQAIMIRGGKKRPQWTLPVCEQHARFHERDGKEVIETRVEGTQREASK